MRSKKKEERSLPGVHLAYRIPILSESHEKEGIFRISNNSFLSFVCVGVSCGEGIKNEHLLILTKNPSFFSPDNQ